MSKTILESEKIKEETFKNDKQVEKYEIKTNQDCVYINNIEVFQTLGKYSVLVTYQDYDDRYSYKTAYLEDYSGDIMFYDGLKVKVPEDKCAVIKDTYEYTTTEGKNKVVPKITFEYEFSPKDEDEARLRMYNKSRESENIVTENCINQEKQLKKEGFKDINQCICYSMYLTDILISAVLLEDKGEQKIMKYYYKDVLVERYGEFSSIIKDKNGLYNINDKTFLKEFDKKIEKKCGKLLNTNKNKNTKQTSKNKTS